MPEQTKSETKEFSETVVTFGGAVKALGNGKVGGFLVRYTNPDEPDLEGDYFDDQTDYMIDLPGKSIAWWQHNLDPHFKRLSNKAELSELETDDGFGVWAEVILDERNQYEAFLLSLAAEGKLGWSSGTASHLVERERKGDAYHITRWPLGVDASLTHTPAEPRNSVIPLKSLSDILPPFPEQESEPDTEQEPVVSEPEPETVKQHQKGIETPTTTEELPMEDKQEEVKTITLTEEQVESMVNNAASKGAEEALKAMPAQPQPSNLEVTLDEADRPFKSLAEQCSAIKSEAVTHGRDYDPRLKRLKVSGAQERVPSEGGFMLEPDLGGEILRPMYETGPFTSRLNVIPTDKAYGWYWAVDETSRATGSRWGGVRGYRLAEGDTITSSKPSFRRITWELKKYAVLVYATDELLSDAGMFEQIVRDGAGEELSFMANDDILNGLGAKGPLGILQSAAVISAGAETGQAATTIVFENISAMWARVLPASKSRGFWAINVDCNPQLDQMYLAAGTGGLEPRFIGYDAQGVMRIKGRPVIETEFNQTLGTAGDIIFIDPAYYFFWEKRGGVQAASSIHVQFVTDETTFRFTYRCDGAPAISSALTPYKGSNTLSPFVTVATRS